MECQIGWLAEHVDGSFSGSIRTLTIHDQITLHPASGEPRGAAANYDVLIGSGARMGVARVDARGIVVELRSPELSAPIVATLEPAGTAGEWLLVWRSP
jgi:uncharacterized protein (DUF736 family)